MSKPRKAVWTITFPSLWRVWWFIASKSGFYKRWNRYKDSIGVAHDYDVYRYWLKTIKEKLNV